MVIWVFFADGLLGENSRLFLRTSLGDPQAVMAIADPRTTYPGTGPSRQTVQVRISALRLTVN